MSLVKAYIEAGTCDEVNTGSLCGEEANSYYKEFEYLGQKVIITNSIPDHEAETDFCKKSDYISHNWDDTDLTFGSNKVIKS